MEDKKVVLESLKNLGAKDDYNLAIQIRKEMRDKKITDTWEYKDLCLLLEQYQYGIAAVKDLHALLKQIGANVLETIF